MHQHSHTTDFRLKHHMKVSKHLLAQHFDPQLRHWLILRFEILRLYYGLSVVRDLSKRRRDLTSLQLNELLFAFATLDASFLS